MNRRLRIRLFLYPLVIVIAFFYSLLHPKIALLTSTEAPDAATTSSALATNMHAEPNIVVKTMANFGFLQPKLTVVKFYIDNDEFDKAAPIAEEIYNSGNTAAINNVGTFYDYKKHYAEALRFFQKALSTDTSPITLADNTTEKLNAQKALAKLKGFNENSHAPVSINSLAKN